MAAGQWNLTGLAQFNPAIDQTMIEAYRNLAHYNFDCGDYRAARDMLAHYIGIFAVPPIVAVVAPPVGAGEMANHTTAGTSSNPNDGGITTMTDDLTLATGVTVSAGAQQQQQDKSEIGNPTLYYLKTLDEVMLQVLWGRLACEILVEDWPAATVAIDAVKAGLESLVHTKAITALVALQQRTWVLHWSLFVYWNDSSNAKGGLEQMVDLFHSERYKQAITTNAPHLLRYLVAAVLLCKRRITKKAAAGSSNAEARRLMKNLMYVIQDCSEYSDPIVEFVNCLCIKFDFDSAQVKLVECEKVLAADFFLCHQTALFMEEARIFVFENYCRIHNKIDLVALGEKLAMDQDQAERWIVDLIRNADNLDAKIEYDDSGGGCVVMGTASQPSMYEQVMERTRDLNARSAALTQTLNHRLNEVRKEKMKKERSSSAAGRDEY
jgi:hypothetical protein